MENTKFIEHHTYYFAELLMLLAGFFMMFIYSYDVSLQIILLMLTLFSYISLGFVHHKIKHTFSQKIVLEYILISALILAGFIFLNFGKI